MKNIVYILFLSLLFSGVVANAFNDEVCDNCAYGMYDTVYLKELIVPDEADSILKNIVIPQLQRNGADSTHSLVINEKNGVLTISVYNAGAVVDFGAYFTGYNGSYSYMVYFCDGYGRQTPSAKTIPIKVCHYDMAYPYDPPFWKYVTSDNRYEMTDCDTFSRYPWMKKYTPEQQAVILEIMNSADSDLVEDIIFD